MNKNNYILPSCCAIGLLIEDANFLSAISYPNKNSTALQMSVKNIMSTDDLEKAESILESSKEIIEYNLNMQREKLYFVWNNDNPLNITVLSEKFKNIGISISPINMKQNTEKKYLDETLKAIGVSGFAAMNVMFLASSTWIGEAYDMAYETRQLLQWVSALITIPSVIYAGMPFFKGAIYSIKKKIALIDLPISIAIILTVLLSVYQIFNDSTNVYFESALMLLFILLISRFMDLKTRLQTSDSMDKIASFQNNIAYILKNGKTSPITIDNLEIGDIIRVPPESIIPMDGIVIKGISTINSSIITGESIPKKVLLNSNVFQGTSNISSEIDVKITKKAENTLFNKVIEILEKSKNQNHKVSKLAKNITKIYTPLVYILFVSSFCFWYFNDGNIINATSIAIACLIITCPCAIAIAIPAANIAAIGKLFKKNILFKSNEIMEKIPEIDTFVFDKTGTLTYGNLRLISTDIPMEKIEIAATLASNSNHPISKAISEYTKLKKLKNVQNLLIKPGYGIEGIINSVKYRFGNYFWATGVNKKETEVSSKINSISYLSCKIKDKMEVISFVFEDKIQKNALNTIEKLTNLGYKIILLSGDEKPSVKNVANALKINTYYYKKNPLEKLEIIEDLRKNNHFPCMVGDGLNDAPSLAMAHISMSPANGLDIAKNNSTIVYNKNIDDIITILDTSKKCSKIMWQNIIFSATYNIIAIPFAFFGFITPLIAAVAMSISSLFVVLNSMRLR